MRQYILDSSFFIQAYRLNYPIDVFPTFWRTLGTLCVNGAAASLDKVKQEIFRNEDELTSWSKLNLPDYFFKSTQEDFDKYSKIQIWLESKREQYDLAARERFLSVDTADSFLVAYCMADVKQRVVVTNEVSAPGSRKTIKIPDVCAAMNVACVNTIKMLRELKIVI